MTEKWVEQQKIKRTKRVQEIKKEFYRMLSEIGKYSEDDLQIFMKEYDDATKHNWFDTNYLYPLNDHIQEMFQKDTSLFSSTVKICRHFPYEIELQILLGENYNDYLDSEPKHYKGTLLITDPCYLMTDEDWDRFCEKGICNIPNLIMRDTIYGDWSCTTFEKETKNILGKFCADAGDVCVCTLEDVLKYNPNFNIDEESDWSITKIPDFDGEVKFVVKYIRNNYNVSVIGRGINSKTGEPIEFYTKQTGI